MVGVKMDFADGKFKAESHATEPIKLLTVKMEKLDMVLWRPARRFSKPVA